MLWSIQTGKEHLGERLQQLFHSDRYYALSKAWYIQQHGALVQDVDNRDLITLLAGQTCSLSAESGPGVGTSVKEKQGNPGW